MNPRVLNMLSTLNSLEIEQQQNHNYIEEMPDNAINKKLSKENRIKVLNNYFFRNKDIYISRHNRFAPYPNHSHTFLEFNYMLQGSAQQIVDGQTITLTQGDLLLLDIGATHSIAALGKNDLLINILFRNNNINIEFLKDLRRSRSVLYDFLLKSSINLQQKSRQQTHLLFKTANNVKISQIIDSIIEEYFLKREYSNTIIKAYLQILITNLVRDYHLPENKQKSKKDKLIIAMLSEVDKNYQSISLKDLAKKYSYNRNYLSNLFKKEVGKSFTDVVMQKKITQAHILITSTTLPVNNIIETVGFSNKNSFYKKYYAFYKEKPLASRQNQNELF
ncbi:helix-turn-helix domain-containing protein [Ligilactobacillus sp. WILCCON 0076]|uniref:Helix-turn-helix domain-containing protein n=1 Tax=Ligilactobacillus ubinensis TaxID=2876789 RepID=A0A9X2FMY3_9LACO|nr:helix-turn-helix domain-containing protein [Ligilactobacillus ubinensis]MCP0887421.1 helix-turn-helix domain-containing protein [Ligilactobacillus ubinensis]